MGKNVAEREITRIYAALAIRSDRMRFILLSAQRSAVHRENNLCIVVTVQDMRLRGTALSFWSFPAPTVNEAYRL